MRINHRHLTLLIFAVAAIAVTVFSYSFLRGFIVNEARETSALAQEISAVEEEKRREEGVATAYEKSAKELAALHGYVVTQDKIVNLIEEIEKIGNDTNTSLELVGITNEDFVTEKGLTYGYFRSGVQGKGTWTNVMRALILIEHLPYSVSISNLRLFEVTVEKNRQWNITFEIKVLTTK